MKQYPFNRMDREVDVMQQDLERAYDMLRTYEYEVEGLKDKIKELKGRCVCGQLAGDVDK